MDLGNTAQAVIHGFERILRWIYPGLLFWALLPLALTPVDGRGQSLEPFVKFYSGIGVPAHIGLIVISGLVFYLFERYIIHEGLLLGTIFFCLHIGAANNFRDGTVDYTRANAPLLWIRFGRRPQDNTPKGERAEDRFDRYMASRMAWVHALGSTWLIGVIFYVIGKLTTSSFVTTWPWYATLVFAVTLIVLFAAWVWHALIAARAEQQHYRPGT